MIVINVGWIALFFLNLLAVALALWVVGRSTVGKEKAKFSGAFWTALIGLIAGTLLMKFIPLLGFIAALILWLALIRHFFRTGWLGALGIAIVALIIYTIIAWVAALLFGVSLGIIPTLARLALG